MNPHLPPRPDPPASSSPLGDAAGLPGSDSHRRERQLAESALLEFSPELLEQTRRLQTILSSICQGIFMVDVDQRISTFNLRACELLDLPERLLATGPTLQEVVDFQTERGDFGPGLSLVESHARQSIASNVKGAVPSYLRTTLAGRTLEVKSQTIATGMVRTFTDVTDYVRATKDRERLDRLIEVTHEIARVGGWDADFAIGQLLWTDGIYRMLDTTPEAYQPSLGTIRQFFTPESHAVVEASYADVVNQPETHDFEIEMITATRRHIWVHSMGATTWEGGRAVRRTAMLQDITERKSVQAALVESELRWKLALESAGDGMWDWHVQTDEQFYSNGLLKMYGYDADETIDPVDGLDLRTHPDDRAQLQRDRQAHLAGEAATFNNERRILCRDGSYKWVLSRGMVISRDARGRAMRMIGTHTDITDRKRAEQALSASEERYRTIVDWSPEAILVHRLGKILYVNPSAIRLFGADHAHELLSKMTHELIHPDFAATQAAPMKSTIDGSSKLPPVESKFLRLDGTPMDVQVQGACIDYGGEPAIHVSIHDISARKQSERYEQFRHDILELLAGDAPLAHILRSFVIGLEKLYPATCCSVLLLDKEGRHLGKGIAPSLPDFFNTALNGMEIGSGVASCGNAAFTGERVIVEDIATHPYWTRYKELAARAGVGSCWSEPIRSPFGQVLGTFAIYHHQAHTPTAPDLLLIEQSAQLASIVIERKQAAAKLQLAAGVFTHAREGIMITEADGTIIDVNEAFTRITGFSRTEAVGQTPRVLSSGRQDKGFFAAMWLALVEQGHWYGEIWNRRKSGEIFPVMQTISALRDATGVVQQYVSMFSDITSLKAHQSQLEHFAHFDALTNLPNRVLLADRLHQAMAQAQRRGQHLAVAYLDLDGFKAINDQHGHEAGDQMLIKLAQRMKLALREGDSLARLGGDEFVAMLIDLEDASACLPMLTRLLAAAAQPVQVGVLTLMVSASVGVTLYPQPQDIDPDQLLRQADQAMYQAKLAGKNRYQIFDAKQDSSVRGHHESLERIRLGLEKREFVLYYQPKVNMRTGKVIGAEALIRWQHPEKGLLSPAVFLPVIEDHPLAVAIGEWVIDAALIQMESWRAVGLDVPVSVNVGARQLQQSDFVDHLRVALQAHPQMSPGSLELELLETSALEDIGQVSEVIEACAAMGVTFALDDFGTGYSSLTYLKRLRVRILKIDKSFVRDMLVDPADLAILKGVIGLAAAFNREVIAEGVETEVHGTVLLELGCELAQGYGIARPMPPDELPNWAAAWQADPVWVDGSEQLKFK